jgi:signal transduction histidine kinase
VMEISDNGKGFDTDRSKKGLGLRNMRERGQMLGGEVEVTTMPGEGTHVRVKVKTPSDSLVES